MLKKLNGLHFSCKMFGGYLEKHYLCIVKQSYQPLKNIYNYEKANAVRRHHQHGGY